MITDDEIREMAAAALKRGDYYLANECDLALGRGCTDKCSASCSMRIEVRAGLESLRDAATRPVEIVTVNELFDLGGEA